MSQIIPCQQNDLVEQFDAGQELMASAPTKISQSREINELAAALAKAQGVIKNPTKRHENPHFRAQYADLAGGLECVRPALSGQDIAILQIPEARENGLYLRTRLIHKSGQWIEGDILVARTNGGQINPHQIGSLLTYARRQSLFAMAGIAGRDDDDDGNSGAAAVSTDTINQEEGEQLMELALRAGASVPKLMSVFKIGNLLELPADKFLEAKNLIAQVAEKRKERNNK